MHFLPVTAIFEKIKERSEEVKEKLYEKKCKYTAEAGTKKATAEYIRTKYPKKRKPET